MNAFENRTILQGNHFNPTSPCFRSTPGHTRIKRQFKSGYFDRTLAGDVDKWTDGVGAVKVCVHIVAPVIRITLRDLRPDGLAVVHVFAFAVFKLTEHPLPI